MKESKDSFSTVLEIVGLYVSCGGTSTVMVFLRYSKEFFATTPFLLWDIRHHSPNVEINIRRVPTGFWYHNYFHGFT